MDWAQPRPSGTELLNFFGSFAISVLGGQGATILDTIAVWPSFLSYGPIAPDGTVDVVLSVDHRVIDGGPAARAIRIIGETLNGAVLDELRGLVPTLGDSNSATTDVREFSKQSAAQR